MMAGISLSQLRQHCQATVSVAIPHLGGEEAGRHAASVWPGVCRVVGRMWGEVKLGWMIQEFTILLSMSHESLIELVATIVIYYSPATSKAWFTDSPEDVVPFQKQPFGWCWVVLASFCLFGGRVAWS